VAVAVAERTGGVAVAVAVAERTGEGDQRFERGARPGVFIQFCLLLEFVVFVVQRE